MIAFMIVYNYDRFKSDIQTLGRECQAFQPDTIVAVARGGMTLAHALCMHLDVRNLQSIRIESYDDTCQRETVDIKGECDFSASAKVLIVDDIVDSGKTLEALLRTLHERYPHIVFKSATLFTKSTALMQPDYSLHEAADWIDFFWERDFLK